LLHHELLWFIHTIRPVWKEGKQDTVLPQSFHPLHVE